MKKITNRALHSTSFPGSLILPLPGVSEERPWLAMLQEEMEIISRAESFDYVTAFLEVTGLHGFRC